MKLKKTKLFWGVDPYYLLFIALLCLLYAFWFQPVRFGDSGGYIMLAEQFLGSDTTHIDLSNRSPFYSIILAVFMKIFGQQHYLSLILYMQFLLVFICGILIYKIFSEILENKRIVAVIGIIFLFNPATITHGFMILTETLTLFFFIYIVFLTVKYRSTQNKKSLLCAAGFLAGLLALTRFNTILISLCVMFCIFRDHFLDFRWKKMGTLAIRIAIFLLPLLVLLNAWSFRNYQKYNFYFPFPPAYGNQRFIEPAFVNDKTRVSRENEEILKIFLRAKKEYLKKEPFAGKDSLSKFIPFKVPHEITSGYKIFKIARVELLEYFKIADVDNPAFLLGDKLKGFFKEIAAQNKFKLFLLRVYSLINSFRASIARLPNNPGINLNVLPPVFFIFYKILFFFLSLSFFLITFIYLIFKLKNRELWQEEHYSRISLLVLIFYFPAINFLAATISDANRFKYPAEPLMLGMLVYYIYYFLKKRKNCGQKEKIVDKPGFVQS